MRAAAAAAAALGAALADAAALAVLVTAGPWTPAHDGPGAPAALAAAAVVHLAADGSVVGEQRASNRLLYAGESFILNPTLRGPWAAGDLFEFVVDTRILPTNNIAERGLREIVVHRKVRGAIRAAEAMEWTGYLFTCVTTREAQGKDRREELVKCA